MFAIDIQELRKCYGDVVALNNISLQVNEGELFGLIGPDGAGKTTLFRILTSLLLPDQGKVSVLGLDPKKQYRKLRTQIGYMPGRFSLYQDLSIEENLNFFATVFGTTIQENYHLIEDIYKQIEPFKTRPAGKLSGGMKQKLALSCALIHKPDLLVLDEPTTGVDAVSRKEFWDMLKKLKSYGITIIVATPYMDEASLCDRVALIQKGNILQVATPKEIEASYQRQLLGVKGDNQFLLIENLRQHPLCHSVFAFGEYIHFSVKEGTLSIEELRAFLSERGIGNLDIKPMQANIEDCFMELMGGVVD